MNHMNRYFNIKHSGEVSTVFLYGDIGSDVDSGRIAAELAACAKEGVRVDVRINSCGGDVFSGIAIYNALRRSDADIRLYVDGVAASMASVIALCGKPVEMSRYARLMLHSVSGVCEGNKAEMERCIHEMEGLESSLAEMCASRMKMSGEEVKKLYFDGADHWLTASEALSMGLVDGIYDAAPVPEGSTPGDVYMAFNNRLRESQTDKDMTIEDLKTLPQFKDCKTTDDVVAKAQHIASMVDKASALTEENEDLKARLKAFEDKAEADAQAERKSLLDAAEQDGRINAETRPTFENILKGSMEEGKRVLEALTPKRRVLNDLRILPGSGSGAWEERMAQIREARAKKRYR